jgi:hypothetical protein
MLQNVMVVHIESHRARNYASGPFSPLMAAKHLRGTTLICIAQPADDIRHGDLILFLGFE